MNKSLHFGVFNKWPQGRSALQEVGRTVDPGDADERLLELIRLHCSVLNGCGYCIAMHKDKAEGFGVDTGRIAAIVEGSAPPPDLTAAESSALALATVMTRLSGEAEMRRVVGAARNHFSDRQLTVLCFQIAAINAWNRLAIADGLEAEHYRRR